MVLQEAKKKMSPTNARALNAMRQRLKKHNINYQEQIKAFRCPCCLSALMLGVQVCKLTCHLLMKWGPSFGS